MCYCWLALPLSISHQSRKARPMVISNDGQVILKSQIELSWVRKFGFPFEKSWWFLWNFLQGMKKILSCFYLRLLLIWNSWRVLRHGVRGMAAWEIPLVFPLEVSTIWTAITQQRKLLVGQTWLRDFTYCKVSRWASWEVRKKKSWDKCRDTWELKVRLSPEKGGIGCAWHSLQLGGADIFNETSCMSGQYSWGWAQWAGQGQSRSTEIRPWVYGNRHTRKKIKARESDGPLISQSLPFFSLPVKLPEHLICKP